MILTLSEKLYGSLSSSYHRKWDRQGGWKAPVPVISVGNITIGGNGKTPFVIALIGLLTERFETLRGEHKIAILSRGYGRRSKELCVVTPTTDFKESGDEPLLLKRSWPNSLVISHAKRVESAKIAVEKFGATLIILDDGFQHRPLARDLDIVLLDSERPLGNGHLIPAGQLRENPAALNRATTIVSVGQGGAAPQFAAKLSKPHVVALPKTNLPHSLSPPSGPVLLLTAVARPYRVRMMAEELGIRVLKHSAFRDHHVFTARELASIAKEAQVSGVVAVLTTSKDIVRIPSWTGCLPLLEIPYQIAISKPDPIIEQVARLLET